VYTKPPQGHCVHTVPAVRVHILLEQLAYASGDRQLRTHLPVRIKHRKRPSKQIPYAANRGGLAFAFSVESSLSENRKFFPRWRLPDYIVWKAQCASGAPPVAHKGMFRVRSTKLGILAGPQPLALFGSPSHWHIAARHIASQGANSGKLTSTPVNLECRMGLVWGLGLLPARKNSRPALFRGYAAAEVRGPV